VLEVDTSSSEEELDDQRTMDLMNSDNPFIKLMIIGRVNTKLKEVIKKPRLNEVDIKLLKGIFLKSTEKKQPKKGLFETFSYSLYENSKAKSRILRRFQSFILKDSIEIDSISNYLGSQLDLDAKGLPPTTTYHNNNMTTVQNVANRSKFDKKYNSNLKVGVSNFEDYEETTENDITIV
jgi:hypothetical protein